MTDSMTYAIPTNSEYWTRESDTVPGIFLHRVADEVAGYVADNWPELDFTTRFVTETTSRNNRTTSSLSDDDHDDIVWVIDNWMSARWPDWLAEYD